MTLFYSSMKDQSMLDTIHVYLRDCVVPLSVGIHDFEKKQPQPVIVHIDVTAPLTRRYDDLRASDTALIIDYDRLYHFVTQELPKLGHVPFLESMAEKILDFCFNDPRVTEVGVRLDKPEAYKGKAKVGIDMRRTRRVS